MNKIKFLYDVVMTMKKKETFKGTVNAEALKDKAKFFSFTNEFEKNTTTGQMKAKISTEVDCEGKKLKNESNFEMSGECCNGDMHHGFMRHIHSHHDRCHEGSKCRGMNKLHMIGFALSVLNSLNVDEQEDKSFLLTLNLKDIPEELKNTFHEKMKERAENHKHIHEHHGLMKELHGMTEPNIEVNVRINKDFEVESLALTISGKQVDEKNAEHEIDASLNLNLK